MINYSKIKIFINFFKNKIKKEMIFLLIRLIGLIIYLPFLILLLIVISLNQRKIKKKLKIDALIFYMIIYICNFIVSNFMFSDIIHEYFIPILLTLLMLLVIYLFSKVSIMGLTGIFIIKNKLKRYIFIK